MLREVRKKYGLDQESSCENDAYKNDKYLLKCASSVFVETGLDDGHEREGKQQVEGEVVEHHRVVAENLHAHFHFTPNLCAHTHRVITPQRNEPEESKYCKETCRN